MQFQTLHAARALVLVALPLCAASAMAQNGRSTMTYFDQNGNPITQETSGDTSRSSITTFDKGVPVITYTSPPTNNGIQNPQGIGGLIANQNIYGRSAPNPNPGAQGYTNFSYSQFPIYPPGYYPYPAPYGYPVQQQPSVIALKNSPLPWVPPTVITNIPLGPGYAYPAPVPYGYPAPGYPYPYPSPYGYPVGGFGYGNGYGNGIYTNNTAGYGISFGRGGFSASIGGSNTTSRSSTSTTITIR